MLQNETLTGFALLEQMLSAKELIRAKYWRERRYSAGRDRAQLAVTDGALLILGMQGSCSFFICS